MKKILFINIFLFLNVIAFGQIEKSKIDNKNIPIPQETVDLKTNSDLFFVGEHLFYKLYCLTNKNQFSTISKIAFVELVGLNTNVVFKHKVHVTNGVAQGDFFIPSKLKSGVYKIIAYTNWTKNNAENSFFEKNIYVINPFSSQYQIPIAESNNDDNIIKIEKSTSEITTSLNSEEITIDTNGKNFKTRETVTISINSKSGINGNYLISVKQKEEVSIVDKNENTTAKTSNLFYLPELRGELLSGKLLALDANASVANKTVSLSIPGKDFIFKNAVTNESGQFYFNINENYVNSNALLQVHEKNSDAYRIEMDNTTFHAYNSLEFNPILINADLGSWINKRSINLQIENAYFSVKQDSVLNIKASLPFYNKADKVYLLDEYTRFKTLKETFVEIVHAASIKSTRDNNEFIVYDYENLDYRNSSFNYNSLVLVDGILIKNHNDFIDYNPENIHSISLVFGNYIYGSKYYDGIIAFETKNGDYKLPNDSSVKYVEYELLKPLEEKMYFTPDYSNKDLKRVPDFRTQLLWIPNLDISSKEEKLTFYTSDIEGTFEVTLEGYTKDGKHILVTEYITIKE